MSLNKLSISSIKKMPVVLGEVDVLKSLLLPGVTNAGEGASGFNVRGGGADQNLILLDEATLILPTFLVFSVFNRCHQRFKLYKGGILPIMVVSVLDIYQKTVAVKSSMLMVEWIDFKSNSCRRSNREGQRCFFNWRTQFICPSILKLSEEQKIMRPIFMI
jgi:hypothetical protein